MLVDRPVAAQAASLVLATAQLAAAAVMRCRQPPSLHGRRLAAQPSSIEWLPPALLQPARKRRSNAWASPAAALGTPVAAAVLRARPPELALLVVVLLLGQGAALAAGLALRLHPRSLKRRACEPALARGRLGQREHTPTEATAATEAVLALVLAPVRRVAVAPVLLVAVLLAVVMLFQWMPADGSLALPLLLRPQVHRRSMARRMVTMMSTIIIIIIMAMKCEAATQALASLPASLLAAAAVTAVPLAQRLSTALQLQLAALHRRRQCRGRTTRRRLTFHRHTAPLLKEQWQALVCWGGQG